MIGLIRKYLPQLNWDFNFLTRTVRKANFILSCLAEGKGLQQTSTLSFLRARMLLDQVSSVSKMDVWCGDSVDIMLRVICYIYISV